MPAATPTIRRAMPSTSLPATQTAKRSSASPMTPPRPAGSGQAAVRGRQAAKLAASTTAATQATQPQPLAVERAVGDEPPAPDRDRQHQRHRRDAEQLHHQVGDDRAGQAEQIAHRRIGGVAERRILHRPASRAPSTSSIAMTISDRPISSRTRRRSASRRLSERLRLSKPRSMADMCDPQPSVATRRCSASAVVSRSCTMATRI